MNLNFKVADQDSVFGGLPHAANTDFYNNAGDGLNCQQDADFDGLGELPALPVLLPALGQGHWHTATKIRPKPNQLTI
ncbi:hypothetical protein [Marinobacter sp. Arc7-DN-1]|uniref:hypothetical protein n=1 Tax=Marinobacter sp. Arc7-DN-1 TaxID=2304594 RepID=UPI000E42F9B0|nr:hypothetical protein [Marinobacter sp. Arc7-DN-1]AXS83571.1 hypothetical protein D0851_11280 [Marinobacter sp. Arc7-DN-1]